jgi:hypothetical protein
LVSKDQRIEGGETFMSHEWLTKSWPALEKAKTGGMIDDNAS